MTDSTPSMSRFEFLCFWRYTSLPVLLSVLFVVLGIPIFLRMPLWCDITLYDVAARSILAGGVHYRDVFDTNTPGYVWCLTVLRATLGTSSIAIRAVDLGIFAGIVILLDQLAKLGGGTRTSRNWAIAGMLSFYPFSTEFIHAQRDVWLALPMLAAVYLRLQRIGRSARGAEVGYFWPAFAEGLLWALATWIKPHVIPLALCTWLLTIPRLSEGSWRCAGRDLAGNLTAGIALGLAGVALLVQSGTWPHFVIVMTEWNGHYADIIFEEFRFRLQDELYWFPPWSLMVVPSVLLVVLALIDGRIFSSKWLAAWERGPIGREVSPGLYDSAPDDSARFARAVLAGTYLIWVINSLVFQRAFLYVHATETLMMMALWASQRWCLPAFVIGCIAAISLLFRIGDDVPEVRDSLSGSRSFNYDKLEIDYRHALGERGYAQRWVACFETPSTGPDDARLKDTLKRYHQHVATTNWEELNEVETFLRSQNVRDREVVCWDEGVHPLYLNLGIQPGLRFMHIHNAERIWDDAAEKIRSELQPNTSLRFVVSDLEWVAYVTNPYKEYERHPQANRYQLGRSPDNLVPPMKEEWSEVFPYDGRKAIFRTDGGRGRYVVFAITLPLGKVE